MLVPRQSTMTEDYTTLLHPQPRRHYDLTPTSTSSSTSSPTTPSREYSRQTSDSSRMEADSMLEREISNNRNRSILNLTSSTLFGIYTPSGTGVEASRDQPFTPWGNGGQAPRHSVDDNKPPVIGAYERPQSQRPHPHQPHQSLLEYILPLGLRTILLFSFGVAYGVIISHLHDHQQVAPVQLEGIEQSSWAYLMAWGGVGVLLGGLLPWIDVLWEEVSGRDIEVLALKPEDSRPADVSEDQGPRPPSRSGSGLGADWNPVVRSVGAFIGIAFAIVSRGIQLFDGDMKLIDDTAQAPLAVDITGIPYLSTRQPCTLVPGRPVKAWLPAIYACRPCGDSHCFWSQPRNSTLASGSITASRCSEHVW